MIAGISGVIEAKRADALLVDVGGVIYRIGTSTSTLSAVGDVGDAVRLYTYLLVREDQLALYGFASQDELDLFEALISASGIGPKTACAVLSRFQPDQLREAISQGNAQLFSTVPGIGAKTAARLIVDLKGKLPEPATGVVPGGAADEDVVAALRSLGYSAAEAMSAAMRVESTSGMTAEERVIAALRLVNDD
ncbi:MAG: Holliday junction branch migration protein RuvA [Thermomicrobiales bacterium]|nr:Holliday junction branch migration protein RuvA [Thermomicrobiales bacterium]MCO5221236.1 Holliday junction branch migration protein RuvA [Thermomicrobiales bacterium]